MSKKKQRIIVAFIMLIVVGVAIAGYNYKNSKHRLLISNKYIEQNSAFQMDTYGNLDRHGYYNRNYTGYMPYGKNPVCHLQRDRRMQRGTDPDLHPGNRHVRDADPARHAGAGIAERECHHG